MDDDGRMIAASFPSTLGTIWVAGDEVAHHVSFELDPEWTVKDGAWEAWREPLAEWKPGIRFPQFKALGSDVRRRVWGAIESIGWGQTRTYAQVAAALRLEAEAVERAVGANPMLLVVPCHRIVPGNGPLRSYGGGIELKRKLLAIEAP